MRAAAARGSLALAAALCGMRIVAACSDYAGAEASAGDAGIDDATGPADAGESDGATGVDAPVTCPVRYLPEEGTYAYGTIFSADNLRINDGSIETQPIDNPYFATVKHEPGGCFRFTAYAANGPKGRHDHSWKFCNACDRSAPSLDLVEETDRFEVSAIGTNQQSTYTCARPNPFLVTDVAPDATIVQSACTGQSAGTKATTLQIVPNSYVYLGQSEEGYQSEDAQVRVHGYARRVQSLLPNASGDSTPDESQWFFDIDSGLPMVFIVIATTSTNISGATIYYKLSLIGRRATSAVSPLLIDP